MTTDNSDIFIGGICALYFTNEATSTDNIKCGYTEETLGIVDTLSLENFSGNGNS
jgi:hypothetical protein